MTVKELIEELQKMDPDRIVVQQDDSEGNGYRLVSGIDDNAAYLPESSWHGDVKYQTLPGEEYDEEDLADESYQPCVVIFPAN